MFYGDSEKTLKTVYKLTSVLLVVFWTLFAFAFVAEYFSKKVFYPLKYREEIFKYSEEYGLEAALIFAMVKTESGFNAHAVSSAGAVGLMQLTAETGVYIADKMKIVKYDLTDADTNIKFGCYYVKYLKAQFSEERTAIAAYNAGEGNVKRWLSDERYSSDKRTLKDIPFAETREYTKKIYKSLRKYKKLYGKLLDKKLKTE